MPKAQQVLRAAIQAISGTSGKRRKGEDAEDLRRSENDTVNGKPLAVC